MSEPLATKSDAVQEAQARAQRLANAFVAVFGPESRRSEEQRLVLGHLATCSGDEQNAYRFNEQRDGVSLIAAGIHRDGAQSVIRIIHRQIQLAEKILAPKKPKPATKR